VQKPPNGKVNVFLPTVNRTGYSEAQIGELKQAGLTDDQIDEVRRKFGSSPVRASFVDIVGRRIGKEEIDQLKKAGVGDEQIEKIREMFERPALFATMPTVQIPPLLPEAYRLLAPTLTEEQTPICPIFCSIRT